MKYARSLLKSFGFIFVKLPCLMLTMILAFLCIGAKQASTPGNSPGLTTFDAPGAGTSANVRQGTVAFGVDATGDIAGFETDANGVHHGFLRSADGTFTEFDASGGGSGKNQGTQALSIDSAGDIAGTYLDSSNLYHGFVRAPNGTMTTFDISGAVCWCASWSSLVVSWRAPAAVAATPVAREVGARTIPEPRRATVVGTSGALSSQGTVIVTVQ